MTGWGHMTCPQVFAMAVEAIAPSRAGCPCHVSCGMAILAMTCGGLRPPGRRLEIDATITGETPVPRLLRHGHPGHDLWRPPAAGTSIGDRRYNHGRDARATKNDHNKVLKKAGLLQ